MAYDKQTWINRQSQINATRMNHMEDGIKNAYNVSLLAVSDTAPAQCSTGDMYYNTNTKELYTATGTNTWGNVGDAPLRDVFYIDTSTNISYVDDGTDLVEIGRQYDLPVYPTPIIVCKSASDGGTLSIASDGGETIIPIIYRNGCNNTNYLSVSNNKVSIGAGVNKVLVNCQLTLGRGPTSYASITLKKNGNPLAFGRDYFLNWNAITFSVVPLLVDVQENDYFEIYFSSSIAGDYTINQGDNSCFITVEAIDVD